MKITIIAVGKTATPYISKAIDAYLERLSHYVKTEIEIIPDIKVSRALTEQQQKDREGEAILSLLRPGDVAVLLDERGKELTSREFAESIERRMTAGLKRLVYIIGGPYGFSQAVYDAVPQRLSLSRMTFTHEMIRLFFTEQIYRAMTILRGEPYHHD